MSAMGGCRTRFAGQTESGYKIGDIFDFRYSAGSECLTHLAQDAPMAFRPPTPAEIDRAVRAWMETSLPAGTGLDSAETFADIEPLSLRIGRAVACQLSERALREQIGDQPAETPCPQCGKICRVTRHTRGLLTVAGEVAYDEPASHCGVCRRDFFSGTSEVASR